MTCKNIASIIDYTNVRFAASEKDIQRTCSEARQYNFRGICVNPKWVWLAKQELKNSSIKIIALIDPPMGLSAHSKRVSIAKQAKKDGADELDVVINVIDVKYGRYESILTDLKSFPRLLPTKVIIGSGYLTDQEIERASRLVKKCGAFCIKTATEKDPLEHLELKEKARHLNIIRKAAPGLTIKAAGKIRSYKDVLMMIEAGADIIGTSLGVKIINECRKENGAKK